MVVLDREFSVWFTRNLEWSYSSNKRIGSSSSLSFFSLRVLTAQRAQVSFVTAFARPTVDLMCDIKCLKTLLLAFNFISWVGINNFELVSVSLSFAVQLKFATAYWQLRRFKGPFPFPWCNARRDPISCNKKFPDHRKPSKIVFLKSHPGHIVNCFTVNTFAVRHFTVLKFVRNNPKKIFFKCHGWISLKFYAAWRHLRIVNKGRTFSYKYFLDFEEKFGKYRTLVTSLQERQRHWQFALQFLFAALHGQQPRPLFRA